jgi:hypothetical protein
VFICYGGGTYCLCLQYRSEEIWERQYVYRGTHIYQENERNNFFQKVGSVFLNDIVPYIKIAKKIRELLYI